MLGRLTEEISMGNRYLLRVPRDSERERPARLSLQRDQISGRMISSSASTIRPPSAPSLGELGASVLSAPLGLLRLCQSRGPP